MLRYVSNIHYDIYNNGGCNLDIMGTARDFLVSKLDVLQAHAKTMGVKSFRRKLWEFVNGGGTFKSRDDVVDVVVSFVNEADQNQAKGTS